MPPNRHGRMQLGRREDLPVVLPFQNQGIDLFLLSQRSKRDLGGLLWALSFSYSQQSLSQSQSLKTLSMCGDVHLSMPLTEPTLDLVEICDTR